MQAMLFDRPGQPLRLAELPVPAPGPNQILIEVAACGVCRTDLHIFDGELSHPKLPLILGHEIVGRVAALGNAELRWTFARATVKRQRLAFILAPFVDAGRTFDGLDELTLRGFLPSWGGAFRMSWNLATLATVDYGISREGSGVYVNFGHMF